MSSEQANVCAISVKNIGKMYRIYPKPIDRLKQLFWGRYMRGGYGREFWALRGADFTVRRGEVLGIIGRNGSGKSTLLQMICATLAPTEGLIEIEGRVSALLELGSGFNPEFTGRENVYLNASILGLSQEQIEKRFEAIAEFADIGPFLDQPVKTYSSGMVVRLAFAVAIHVDPEVLVVDEALAVGDLAFQAKCYRKFREFRERGVTILLVTHDLGSILRLCDRVLVLDEGKQVGLGEPKTMVDLYKRLIAARTKSETGADLSQKPLQAGKLLKESQTINAAHLEYGDKAMEIIDFALLDDEGNPLTVVCDDQPVNLMMSVLAHQTVEDPILAFMIKDLAGHELTGSNTLMEDMNPGECRAGDRLTMRCRMTLPLQNGPYALSLGCTELALEGLVVHHRLYDILLFEVRGSRKFAGQFDVKPAMEVTRQQNAPAMETAKS